MPTSNELAELTTSLWVELTLAAGFEVSLGAEDFGFHREARFRNLLQEGGREIPQFSLFDHQFGSASRCSHMWSSACRGPVPVLHPLLSGAGGTSVFVEISVEILSHVRI